MVGSCMFEAVGLREIALIFIFLPVSRGLLRGSAERCQSGEDVQTGK